MHCGHTYDNRENEADNNDKGHHCDSDKDNNNTICESWSCDDGNDVDIYTGKTMTLMPVTTYSNTHNNDNDINHSYQCSVLIRFRSSSHVSL